MPRRNRPEPRILTPDPRYNSVLVTRLINKIMKSGKKTIAEKIVYNAFENVEKNTGKNGSDLLEQAVRNTSPILEVKSRRVGGATYQVPVDVKADRRISLSIRWLIDSASSRQGKSMSDKLANELTDAFNNTGGAVKKKEDVHRMAEANRAFAHYRW
ncbi:MAG: 30S ribosomal protein S7 [Dehalococcoidia bacterium]|tara:strand:+ start:2076 stop:2546 length:471 start_codon:yes stop_codon:yes gene_type:complete